MASGHWCGLQTKSPWPLAISGRTGPPAKDADAQLHGYHEAEVGRTTGCHRQGEGSVSGGTLLPGDRAGAVTGLAPALRRSLVSVNQGISRLPFANAVQESRARWGTSLNTARDRS